MLLRIVRYRDPRSPICSAILAREDFEALTSCSNISRCSLSLRAFSSSEAVDVRREPDGGDPGAVEVSSWGACGFDSYSIMFTIAGQSGDRDELDEENDNVSRLCRGGEFS